MVSNDVSDNEWLILDPQSTCCRSNAREQQVLRKAAGHWRSLSIAQAFGGWKDRCQQRRNLQHRLMAVAMRINAPILASAMAAWRDYWAMQLAKKDVLAGLSSLDDRL